MLFQIKKIFIILLFLLLPLYVSAQPTIGGFESVSDGSTICYGYQLLPSGGTVTDNNNGTCTFTVGGGADITSVGDVVSGAAFDGTQGRTLTFNNAGGDATIDYDGTDFDITKGLTLPDGQKFTTDGAIAQFPCTKTICSSTTNIREDQCDYITDGTADNVQWQDAIDAVYAGSATGDMRAGGSGKGRICATEGTYDFAATVEIKPGINFYCTGLTSCKIQAESAITNMFQFTEPAWTVKTGTISTVGSSTTITGSGTAFTTDFSVGNWISTGTTGTNGRKILAIASNTSMTVDTAVDLSTGGPYNPYQNVTAAGFLMQGFLLSGNSLATTALDSKAGVIPLWDVQMDQVYIFDFLGDALVIDSPWGFRFFNGHIEDNTGWGIKISQDQMDNKDDGAIISLSKIIQNDAGGIQLNDVAGAVISSNEICSEGTSTYAIDIEQGSLLSGNGNIIIGNKIFDPANSASHRGILIDTGATSNMIMGNTIRGHVTTNEIDNNGTNTIIVGNRGEGEANTDNVPNTVNFTDGDITVNSNNDGSGNFIVNSDNVSGMFYVNVAVDLLRLGTSLGANYAQFDSDGDLTFAGTGNYLVGDAEYAFRAEADEDIGLFFGSSHYQFKGATAEELVYIDIDGDVGIYGSGARYIRMERHPTANTAGNDLTIQAGGATSGATDKDGGILALVSGTATGDGESRIVFQTVQSAQGTGTTDRSPVTMMQLDEGNHLEFLAGPTISVASGCGTGPSAGTGYTDIQGKITMGTGTVTSCVLNFGKTWTNAPACIITGDQTSVQYRATTSTTQLTITSDVTMDGDVVMYHCLGGE